MRPTLGTYRNLTISLCHIPTNPLLLRRRLIHYGPDTIDELLDRQVDKNQKSQKTHDDDEEADLLTRQRLTSMRREALSLYRDVLRAARFFAWADPHGVLWRDVLREKARSEFEAARFEMDPEVVTRLLIGGRDAVHSALDKLAQKQREEIDKQQADRNRR